MVRRNKKVPDFIYLSTNTVKFAVMKADCRRKKPPRNPGTGKIQLLRPVNHIANLLPGYKIFAPENRQTRQIRKRRAYKIVISPRLADRRIRIKPRQNRIYNSCGHKNSLYTGLPFCPRHCERSNIPPLKNNVIASAAKQSINIILYYCYL